LKKKPPERQGMSGKHNHEAGNRIAKGSCNLCDGKGRETRGGGRGELKTRREGVCRGIDHGRGPGQGGSFRVLRFERLLDPRWGGAQEKGV